MSNQTIVIARPAAPAKARAPSFPVPRPARRGFPPALVRPVKFQKRFRWKEGWHEHDPD